jgi:hypothetical protein
MNEIKELFRKLLDKKYQKALNSIPEYKRIELLEYANNVHTQAWMRINGLNNVPATFKWPAADWPYDWPYPLHPSMKIEDKLREYLIRSEIIIGLLTGEKSDETINERALLMVYKDESMMPDKSKLFQKLRHYRRKTNRVGTELTSLRNKHKVELFEKVIERLSGNQKIHAEKDLEELKNNINNQAFTI